MSEHPQIPEQSPKPPPIAPVRKKTRSLKSLFMPKYGSRAPSREFNDPIYAGFDINQENKEQLNWGPWIVSNQGGLRNSHSLQSGLKKIVIQEDLPVSSLSVNRKSIISLHASVPTRSPSRSELPQIKQKPKPNFLELKLGQLDNPRHKKSLTHQLKLKPKPTPIPNDSNYQRKPIDPYYNKNWMKLGTVVYNYCTNHNVDQCLLNYNSNYNSSSNLNNEKRRSDLAGVGVGGTRNRSRDGGREDQLKEEMIRTRYEGLKAYWRKRNSSITAKQNQ